MLRKLADILAVIFHPVFMGTAVLLIFSAKRDDLPVSTYLLASGLILLFTLIIPVAATYFLHKDIHLQHRKQRFWPLIITFASHLCLYFSVRSLYDGKPLMLGIILLSINLLVLLIFTSFIKASMHANAIAIVLWILTMINLLFLGNAPNAFYIFAAVLSVFLAIVIWQRIVSKAHTITELIAGFISGLISVGLTLIYIERFGY